LRLVLPKADVLSLSPAVISRSDFDRRFPPQLAAQARSHILRGWRIEPVYK
jgi:hypothetical protein